MFFLKPFIPRPGMSFILGKPGAGKTTTMAACVDYAVKNNIRCFSNVPILGSEILSPKEQFGKTDLTGCMLLLDEAQLFFDNRKWKSNFNDDDLFDFISKYRHYEISYFVLASQGLRIDVKLIDLFNTVYLLHKLPFNCVMYDIYDQDVTTDEKGQFIHCYERVNMKPYFYYGRPYYGMFNSYERKKLPPTPYNPWTREVVFKDLPDPLSIISSRLKNLSQGNIYDAISIYG